MCEVAKLKQPHVVQVRDSLEVSFVAEAEMVFTTLSSTGRKVFERGTCGRFHTVLIDEAAQSSEIAALQPLTFGCKRCTTRSLQDTQSTPSLQAIQNLLHLVTLLVSTSSQWQSLRVGLNWTSQALCALG